MGLKNLYLVLHCVLNAACLNKKAEHTNLNFCKALWRYGTGPTYRRLCLGLLRNSSNKWATNNRQLTPVIAEESNLLYLISKGVTGENDLPLLFRFQISWFLNTNTNIEELELFDPLVSNRILIRITLKNKIPSRMYKTSVAGNQIYNLKSEWAQSFLPGYFENAPNFVNFLLLCETTVCFIC